MALFAVTSLVCLFYKQEQLAAVAGLFLGFAIWSHFKQSSILLASKYFKAGDYKTTERLLAEVPNPDRLLKSRRGYYEFMKANIALQMEAYEEAEVHFQIASRFPLGGTNDTALVLIHLANLALRRKDKVRVLAYVNRAKELGITERTKNIINKIETEANSL